MAREKTVRVVRVPVLGAVVLITREEYDLAKVWVRPRDLKPKSK